LRSISALFAGAVAVVVLSIATDLLLVTFGVFPGLGQPMSDGLLLVATCYRTLFGFGAAYLTAFLAPDRPLRHTLVLGLIGLVMSIGGGVATWNKEPAVGHEWYPIALVVLALPPAWAAGRLREIQLQEQRQVEARATRG